MARFSDILKNIFFLFLILQIAPSVIKNIQKQYVQFFELHSQVGLISIDGDIRDSMKYVKHIKSFFKNPEIKAIVLKINSGGGAAGSGQAIFNEINLLQKKYPKPIITITENTLASAAYYIAAATNMIISSPSTLIGSIGGYLPHQFKLNDLAEQWKVHVETVSAGKYKMLRDPFTSTTPEGKAILQSIANDAYQQFIQDISKSRKLSLENATEWAEGKIFTGNQALKLGLIDEIGSWSNAVERIREKALIEGKIEWVTPPKPSAIFQLFGSTEENDDPTIQENSHRSFMDSFINSFINIIEERYRAHNTIS